MRSRSSEKPKALGIVAEVPPPTHDSHRFDEVWEEVAKAQGGQWCSYECTTAGRAHGLTMAARKRKMQAERRKCRVYIRRPVRTKV